MNRPRLLVVNPNSDPAVTALIAAAAARALPPGAAFRVASPPGAPRAIETAADRQAVEAAVAALIAGSDCDATALACFDDIGAAGARAMGAGPVVDAVAASVLAARALADRFAVVTTVAAAAPGIRARLAALGAAGICAVRAAGVGVGEAAAREPAAMAQVEAAARRAVAEDGAQAIILGSGGLAGLAGPVAQAAGAPVIDAIEAAAAMAWAVAGAVAGPGCGGAGAPRPPAPMDRRRA
jgi:allantoin racemase